MRRRLDLLINLALACALGGLLWLSWEAHCAYRDTSVSRREVLQVRSSLFQTVDLLAQLGQVVSLGRGYVITGEPSLLEGLEPSLQRLSDLTETLGTQLLTAEERAAHEVLRGLIARRIELLRTSVSLRQEKGFADAEAYLKAGPALEIDDEIRLMIGGIRQREAQALDLRLSEAENNVSRLFLLMAVALVVSFALVAMVFTLLRREINSRRRAASALEREAQRFRNLYNHAPCGYISLDAAGVITSANHTLLRQLGRSREAVERRLKLEQVLSTPSRDQAAALLAQAEAEQRAVEGPAELVTADGTHVAVNLIVAAAIGASAPDERWFVTIVDATERRRADDVVRKARYFAETIVDTVETPLLTLRGDLTVQSANRSFYETFDTSAGETIDRALGVIAEGRFSEAALRAKLQDVNATRTPLYGHRLTFDHTGRRLVYELSARALQTFGGEPGSGDPGLLLLMVRDVTAREAYTAALLESQLMFRRLFENSPDAMILADQERRIVRANTRAQELFGWDEHTLSHATIEHLLPHRFRARHAAHMAAYFQNPRARPMGAGLELLGLRGDGTEFPVDIMLSPLDTDQGLQVLAVVRDISERVQADRRIQELNRDLRRRATDLEFANQELEAFSYSVSHDLRAPLRHITGFAEMLRSHAREGLDAKGRRYLDTIGDSAKRMGALIEDLLLFSRVSRTQISLQKVPLQQVVEEVRRSLEKECQDRTIVWEISPLPEVSADLATLRQVIYNLLANAVKYTRKRTEAKIEVGSATETPGEFIFYIRDNGAGFDMRYADKLFGVFQRLHGATEFEGTGVGLAIVRRVIQRHGGRTWAEGAVDQGATFFFSLPKDPKPE